LEKSIDRCTIFIDPGWRRWVLRVATLPAAGDGREDPEDTTLIRISDSAQLIVFYTYDSLNTANDRMVEAGIIAVLHTRQPRSAARDCSSL
jgi:hypothetical protein